MPEVQVVPPVVVEVRDDPCRGHECDHCSICEPPEGQGQHRGHCCRKDQGANYRLPEVGTWPYHTYGELGVLKNDGERVCCHICGDWYLGLDAHSRLTHDVTADEYRAYFGLNRTQELVGPATSEKLSKLLVKRIAKGEWGPESENYVKPTNTLEGRRQSGSLKPRLQALPHLSHPHSAETKAAMSEMKRGKYPEKLAKTWGEKLRKKYGVASGMTERTCPNCGTVFTRPGRQVQRACSKACAGANRRHTAEAKAKVAEAKRVWWAERRPEREAQQAAKREALEAKWAKAAEERREARRERYRGKTCVSCGGTFDSWPNGRLTCSDACKRENMARKGVERWVRERGNGVERAGLFHA